MAAEFAQSKRCYSTISTKIQNANNKNSNNNPKQNNKLFYHGIQEIINMNNLKNNLPGKATPIIDNTENIMKTNYAIEYEDLAALSLIGDMMDGRDFETRFLIQDGL